MTVIPEYTDEEINLFEEMYEKALCEEMRKHLERDLQRFIGQSTSLVRDLMVQPIAEYFVNLDKTINEHRHIWNPMLEATKNLTKIIPLEEMPLLINNSDIYKRTVAIWRLKIGK